MADESNTTLRPLKERLDDPPNQSGDGKKQSFTGVLAQRLNITVTAGDVTKEGGDGIVCFLDDKLQPIGEETTKTLKIAGTVVREKLTELVTGNKVIASPSVQITTAGNLPMATSLIHAILDEDTINYEGKLKPIIVQTLQTTSAKVAKLDIPCPTMPMLEHKPWPTAQLLIEAALEYAQLPPSNDVKLQCINFVCSSLLFVDVVSVVCRKLIGSVVADSRPTVSPPTDNNAVGDDALTADKQQNATTDTDRAATTNNWYTIKEVIKRRKHKGRMQYLVRWEETNETDWVEQKDITDYALQQFVVTHERRKRRRQ